MVGDGRMLTHPRGPFFNPADDRRAVNFSAWLRRQPGLPSDSEGDTKWIIIE
jgi:hypothetical protein